MKPEVKGGSKKSVLILSWSEDWEGFEETAFEMVFKVRGNPCRASVSQYSAYFLFVHLEVL